MTAIQKKADNPIAHLTDEDVENLGRELDASRAPATMRPKKTLRGVRQTSPWQKVQV